MSCEFAGLSARGSRYGRSFGRRRFDREAMLPRLKEYKRDLEQELDFLTDPERLRPLDLAFLDDGGREDRNLFARLVRDVCGSVNRGCFQHDLELCW